VVLAAVAVGSVTVVGFLTRAGTAGASVGTAATTASTTGLDLQWQWSRGTTGSFGDTNEGIFDSSPTVATLDGGGPSVVVADRSGKVYAFHLSNGSPVAGWPVSTGVGIDSTPSAAPIGGSSLDSIFIGVGNVQDPTGGGYEGIGPGGNQLWSSAVIDPGGDTEPFYAVQASLSVGALQGPGPDVVAGSLDQEEYALDATTGATLPGWPFYTSDSVFSTAALGDLYGNGETEIVEGSDQTAGFANGRTYFQGGHLRILNGKGGLICNYDTDQTVFSSPAIGNILPGGGTGIVVGTGSYFSGASNTDQVLGFNTTCGLQWATTLDGTTLSSPALADVTGNGSLDAVEGTQTPTGGSVWVLNAADGAPIWHAATTGAVIGSVTTADLTGAGYQDLLVPTTLGVDIFDGRTHQEVAVLNGFGSAYGPMDVQNSPLVTDDPDGAAGITVAGYQCPPGRPTTCYGKVVHYEIPGSDGALAVGAGSWPEFHHDPQLTGNVGTPVPGSIPACTIPSAATDGYDLVASDGGIFSFGSTPFCGSTGGITLNAPVVGMARAPDSGGYWLAAADGGVFAFGGAQFYGSMGGKPLNEPIVGIAATPDGQGYWLVAADGGIFSFGNAQFYGSTGGMQLNKPIVGMAATADGRGYRLVAADGGIFDFGDAQFFGSMGGQPLNRPIVGMADDVATGGYWEVAADGGVFSFRAPFFGSMGGSFLAAPIVGMAATLNGAGYRFVASDGGVFTFGDATFDGSMGGKPLNKPVVGMAGF